MNSGIFAKYEKMEYAENVNLKIKQKIKILLEEGDK